MSKTAVLVIFLLATRSYGIAGPLFEKNSHTDSQNDDYSINVVENEQFKNISTSEDSTEIIQDTSMEMNKENSSVGVNKDPSREDVFLGFQTSHAMGKNFGFFINAGHFWKPFFSKFQFQIGSYPNNYYSAYTYPEILKYPGTPIEKIIQKASDIFKGFRGAFYAEAT